MSTKSNFSLLVMICGFAIVTQSGCSTKYVASSEKSLAYLQVFNMSGEPDKTAFISTYQGLMVVRSVCGYSKEHIFLVYNNKF